MAPKLEVDGLELGGNGGAVRGRRRETAEILCGAVAYAATVAAADLPGLMSSHVDRNSVV